MNLHDGLPFWLVKNGLPFNYYSLEESIDTEIAILGGGISGALAAHYLVEAGFSCVILDARSIGLGSTCASTALLQYEIDVPLVELQHKVGLNQATRAYTLCDQAIDELENIATRIEFGEFEKKKSLYFASSSKDQRFIEQEFEMRNKVGLSVELLSKKEVKQNYGLDSYGAILSHHAAQMDPYLYTHHLLQHSMRKGLKVFDRTHIQKIKYEQDRVRLETDQKRIITARKIIYANGYEAVKYIDQKLIQLYSTFAIAGENHRENPLPAFTDTLAWNTSDPYFYMRTTSDNRLICGGRDEKFKNDKKRDELRMKKAKLLEKDVRKLFPKISFQTEFSWCGTFASTSDGLPFIGEYKKLPHSFVSLGFGGNGITFAQIAAKVISDLIAGIENPDTEIFQFNRK